MSEFDPSKLAGGGKSSGSSKPRAERVFMEVDHYEVPPDGFHYAVGRRIDNPAEEVRVRLTTVAERVKDRGLDEAKVTDQYATGKFHRESIGDKDKANIRLLSFDEAFKIGTDANGVAEYRAHWPNTMATNPSAEVLTGLAHVELRDAVPSTDSSTKRSARAYIEVLKESAVVDKDNIDEVLNRALSIKDEEGRARDPVAIVRVLFDEKQAGAPRIYPAFEKGQVFDQALGGNKEVSVKADAAVTLANILAAKPTPGFNDFDTENRDLIRAIVAGVKGQDEPEFLSKDKAFDRARQFYFGSKEGQLQIEVVAVEKIDFGLDSGKTYLTNKDRPQLAAYNLRETAANDTVRETPAFMNTVIAVHRHPDGEPYAIFAAPTELWPKPENGVVKLADLPVESLPKMALASDAAKVKTVEEPERQAESSYESGPGM